MNTKDNDDLKRVDAIIDRHARAMRESSSAMMAKPVVLGKPVSWHILTTCDGPPSVLSEDARNRVLAVARDAMAEFGREWEKRQRRQIDRLVENMTKLERLDGLAVAIKRVVHAPTFDAAECDTTIQVYGLEGGSIARRAEQRILDAFRSECTAVREECLSELRAMGLTVEG
jgi:hypothetical protein